MKSDKPSFSRRVYLINPKFQLRAIAYALFIATTTILVFYISNLFFFWKILDIGNRLHLPLNHPFFEFIQEQKDFMSTVFLVTAVIDFFVITIIGLIWSHRVAGPMYRLHMHLNKIISEGVYKKLNFRKKDSFSELAESLNLAMEVVSDSNKK